MYKIKISTILKMTQGTAINLSNLKTVEDVVIDDREVKKNSLFVAIIGKNFDGHSFVDSAFKKGASLAITEKKIANFPQIIVKNTKKALIQIAIINRSLYKRPLIGITGSVGKTTTKEMLSQILETMVFTLKTNENLNNEIGVSKTLLNLNNMHKAAVVEMGMSNFGEISLLSKTSRPTIGIITNIGISHIEFLKSKENILKAKLEILDGMQKNSVLILNGDDDYLKNISCSDYNIIFCGIKNEKNIYKAKNIRTITFNTKFDLYKKNELIGKISLPTIGNHNILNSLLAIAAADNLGVPFENIYKSLKQFTPAGMRQNIFNISGIIVIADYYNASPDSVKAALTILDNAPSKGKKIAVLGNMLELGEISEKAHFEIGEFIENKKIDIIYCLGEAAKNIVFGAKHNNKNKSSIIKHFKTKEKLIYSLKKILKPNDIVLFKASRKENFEDICTMVFNEYTKKNN